MIGTIIDAEIRDNCFNVIFIDERVKDIVNSKWALSNYVIDDDTSDEVINSLKNYIKELQ